MADKRENRKEQDREDPAAFEIWYRSSHVRFPRLLVSILYASPRSCNELANPK